MRIKRERDFISLFDEKTGHYLHTGILEGGRDTGKDPFMASFPELIDVGVIGHCTHGVSGLCQQAGIRCYQRGPTTGAPNMSLEDFAAICEQCEGRTFQFALGGGETLTSTRRFATCSRRRRPMASCATSRPRVSA